MLQERQRKAAEHKQRTLAMYDNMAKSAPAGGKKKMDIGILQTGQSECCLVYKGQLWLSSDNEGLTFFSVTPPSTPTGRDNEVEDVLQQCKQAAEDRKKKILVSDIFHRI